MPYRAFFAATFKLNLADIDNSSNNSQQSVLDISVDTNVVQSLQGQLVNRLERMASL